MIKNELIDRIAKEGGYTKVVVSDIVERLISCVEETVTSGESVQMRGFGTFSLKERAARTGRNVHTGEKVKIEKRKVPVFTPGKSFCKEK